jgi:nucleoside phosphorylase
MSDKKSSSGKRGEIRELKKDERFKSFMDTLQEKYRADAMANAEKLRIEAEKAEVAKIEATTKAKEVELKMFVEETRVMTQDLTILDANTRAWYKKRQREIMAHDM